MRRIFLVFPAVLLSFMFSSVAMAEGIPSNVANQVRSTTSIEPTQAGSQDLQNTPPAPTSQTAPSVAHPPQTTLPPEAAKIKFVLKQVIVDGNTVYSKDQIQAIAKPYLNRTISLLDLEQLTQDYTKKFRTDGYIISRAILPPQSIKNGVVHIQILEGFVSKVEVKGEPGYALPMVKTYGDKVLNQKPLTIQKLERYLLLSNDLPGMSARGILTPSKTVPGGADLILATEQKHASGFISYDNYGSRYLGPNRVSVGADVNSIFTAGDTTSFRSTVSTDIHDLLSVGLSHSLLLGSDGARLTLGGSISNTAPSFVLQPLLVRGRSEYLFADVSYPIIRSRPKNLLIHASANYLNSRTNVLSQPLYNDRVRYLKAGATFSALDRFQGVNLIGFDFSQGLKCCGVSAADPSNPSANGLSRANGRIDFTKLEANASRLQALGTQWSALGALTGQYAYTPLLSAQQFGIGGSDFGRGYSPSEILGDSGLAGKFELRWSPKTLPMKLQQLQLYGFYDIGAIWNTNLTIAAAVGTPRTQSLASAGAGMRFQIMKDVSGDVFIAKPLTRPVAQEVLAGQNANRPMGFFQITLAM